jgi:hypothetical protein
VLAMMLVANGADHRLNENSSGTGIGTNRRLELPYVGSFEMCLLDDRSYAAVQGRNLKSDLAIAEISAPCCASVSLTYAM